MKLGDHDLRDFIFKIRFNGSTDKRIFSNEITYPFYSNRTSESVQCSSDLCNNDESFYENSVSNFDHHDENITCYTCTGQRDSDPDSCRMPNESTPTCQAGAHRTVKSSVDKGGPASPG